MMTAISGYKLHPVGVRVRACVLCSLHVLYTPEHCVSVDVYLCVASAGVLPFQHSLLSSDMTEWLVRKTVVDIVVDSDSATVASQMPELSEGNYSVLFKILDSPLSFRLKMQVRLG
jgi:hypothetical protein